MNEEKNKEEVKRMFKKGVTVNYIPPEEVTRHYEKIKPERRHFRLDDCLGNYGKELIDKAGYISPKEQMDNFRRAGINLDAFRRAMYVSKRTPDDIPINEVAKKGFDEFDAHDLINLTDSNMKKAIAQAKEDAEKKLQEAAKQAENKESPPKVSEGAVTPS